MFCKRDVLENSTKFTGKRLSQTLLTSIQILSYELFESLRNIFFTEHLRTTASNFNLIFFLF